MKLRSVGGFVVAVFVVGVAVFVAVALAANASRGSRLPLRGEAPWPSAAVSAAPVAASAPAVGFLAGDGESLVPEQVAPGTYLSPGPSGDVSCYAFVMGEGGSFLSYKVQKGQTVLVVPAGATAVRAHFCQPFVKVR